MERSRYTSTTGTGPQIVPATYRAILIIQNHGTAGFYGFGKSGVVTDADIPMAANERIEFEVAPTSELVINTAGDCTITQNSTWIKLAPGDGFDTEFSSAFG